MAADEKSRVQIQRDCYTRWINSKLTERSGSESKHVTSLYEDLRDGITLLSLVQELRRKFSTRKVNLCPVSRQHMIDNVSVALGAFAEDGVDVRDIVAADITDGNEEATLRLLWTLIKHYSIDNVLLDGVNVDDDEDESKGERRTVDVDVVNSSRQTATVVDDALVPIRLQHTVKRRNIFKKNQSAEKRLLNWTNSQIVSDEIERPRNFTTDWRDGIVLAALIDGLEPGVCPDWENWDPENALSNCEEAINAAERCLNIAQLITPAELSSSQIDECSVMTYLAQFCRARLKPGTPIKAPKFNPWRSGIYKMSVESDDGLDDGREIIPVTSGESLRTCSTSSNDSTANYYNQSWYLEKTNGERSVRSQINGATPYEDELEDGHFPASWGPEDPSVPCKRVELDRSDPEYIAVLCDVQATTAAPINVIRIERIENRQLFRNYTAIRKNMTKANEETGVQNERKLWHGACAKSMEKVIANGFNRSYCRQKATCFGNGVYFSTDFWYSAHDKYAKRDPVTHRKHVMLCRVLTGCYTAGLDGMLELPKRVNEIAFDSAVNDVNRPSIFVVFRDAQAYPEYVVTFTNATSAVGHLKTRFGRLGTARHRVIIRDPDEESDEDEAHVVANAY